MVWWPLADLTNKRHPTDVIALVSKELLRDSSNFLVGVIRPTKIARGKQPAGQPDLEGGISRLGTGLRVFLGQGERLLRNQQSISYTKIHKQRQMNAPQ